MVRKMKLKGFLAYSIKKLRELYELQERSDEQGDRHEIWYRYWSEYFDVLCFVADYYRIDRWRYLERLVLDPEVEV